MKKLFVSLLAIAGMVACTNDEVVSVQQGNPIAFDTFVENTTRVLYDSSNLPEGFNVWAFIENADEERSTILDAEDVERQDGQYVYSNTQYWVPGNTYYFAALAPMDSQNVTNLELATGDAAKKGLGTFDFENKNGTEDLIYAVKMVEANENTNKVTFTFNHLLSKVKFSFTNTFDNANYSIQVRDIAMTVPMSGNVNLAADDVEWTLGTTSLGLDFDETGIIAKDGNANSAELLTIPAGDTQVYDVVFFVDLYVGNGAEDNKVLAKTYKKESQISGIKFEAGKAYNFAAAINAESLALNEVIFDASVNGWDDAATVQLIDTAAELVDAFKAPEVDHIILDGNIDLSDLLSTLSTRAGENAGLVINAGRTLTLDLNGCTISQSKAQTGSYAMIDNKGTLIIEDNSSSKNGKISFKDTGAGDPTYGWGSYTICNNGNLIVNGGTIENLSEQAAHMYCAIFQYSGSSTINGGKISTPNYRSARLWHGDMTIKGGQFEGQLWLQAVADNTSNLTIEGGSFAPRGGDFSSVFVENDTYNVAFAVTGGHFETKIGMSKPFGCITGGTFTTAAKEGTNVALVNDDYYWVEDNGNWTLARKADVAKIGEVGYTSLAKAIAAVEDGGTITLVANEVFTETNRYNNGGWWDGLGYSGDKSFTIDLGGKTVSQNGALNDYLIWIKNVGSKANTITIKNGTLDAGTTAYCALCTASSHDNQLTINLENITLINKNSNGSTVKVRAGSVVNVKAGTKITGKDSYLGIENWKATVNIYDGAEIYMNGTSSYNGCLAGAGGGGTINVYGGYGKGVKGGFIAMTSGGTINVSGGEWIANTDGSIGNNSNLYVLTAQSNKNESGFVGGAYINVTGGTFRGGMDAWVLNNVEGEEAKLNISGGNFNANPSSYLAEGCEATEVNGVWTVRVLPVAKVGETEYETLEAAAAAAQAGDTITVLRDITLAEELSLPADITLDGNGKQINGKNITVEGNVTIKGDTKIKTLKSTTGCTITIEDGKTLALNNFSFGSKDNANAEYEIKGGTVTANYGFFQHGKYALRSNFETGYMYYSYGSDITVYGTFHSQGKGDGLDYVRGKLTIAKGGKSIHDKSLWVGQPASWGAMQASMVIEEGGYVQANSLSVYEGSSLTYSNDADLKYNSVTGTEYIIKK